MNEERERISSDLVAMSTTTDGLFGNDDSIPFPAQWKGPFANEDHRRIHRLEQRPIDDHRPVVIGIGAVLAHAFQEGIFVLSPFRIAFFVDHQSVVRRLSDLPRGMPVLQLTVRHLFEEIQRVFIVDLRGKNELHQGKNVEREKGKDLEDRHTVTLVPNSRMDFHSWSIRCHAHSTVHCDENNDNTRVTDRDHH